MKNTKYIWIWPNRGSMNLSNKNVFWGTFQEYKIWVENTFHKTLHKKMLQESFRYSREGKGNPNEG